MGQLCRLCAAVVLWIVAGRVKFGIAALPGQTGHHLLLDLLSVAVLTLRRQHAAHLLPESLNKLLSVHV